MTVKKKFLCGISLDLFTIYSSNCRKQFVNINDIDSSVSWQYGGVPQRSIPWPLLFINYINDIVDTFELTNFIIFTDDTNLFFKKN